MLAYKLILKCLIIFLVATNAFSLENDDFIFGDKDKIKKNFKRPSKQIELRLGSRYSDISRTYSSLTGIKFLGRFTDWQDEPEFSYNRFGTGLIIDYFAFENNSISVGMPLNYTIGRRTNLYIMPSAIIDLDENNKVDYQTRFGINYEFTTGNIAISPFVSQDIRRNSLYWNFGISVGYKF